MRLGLITSFLVHAALLAWAVIDARSPRDLRAPKVEPMAVSIITADELTRLKKGSRDAKQKDAVAKKQKKPSKTVKQPKKVARVVPPAAPLPPKVDPIAEALAKAEKEAQAKAKADAAKKAAAEKKALLVAKELAAKKAAAEKAKKLAAAEKKAAEKKRKAAARKKALAKKRAKKRALARKKKRDAARKKKRLAALAKKKKKTFDADRFSALLNKLPNDTAPRPSSDKPLPRAKRARAGLGAPEGKDDRLTASEEAVLKSIISRQLANCWSLPGGGGGTEVARVTLSWRLDRDGMLDGEPKVLAGRNDPLGRIAQEAAIRAVKTCVPFRLPPDKYRAWKLIEWEFDPRQML